MTLHTILKKKIEHDRSEIFFSQMDLHSHLSSHFSVTGWVPWEADSEKELNIQIVHLGVLSGTTRMGGGV